jgi:hypothetical protein
LRTFADLCFALPEVITVNANEPECNGPFLTCKVPDFEGAKAGTEHKGFYIILPITKEFLYVDDTTNWFSANVTSSKHIMIRIPAFPYPLWPWLKDGEGEQFMKTIQEQVPEPVRKAMNHAHSAFAPDADAAQTQDTLSRQWKYFLLDFSSVKDLEDLSSNILFAEAGPREALDYDVIQVPIKAGGSGKEVLHYECLLGFKVGCIDPDREGGRKVARLQAKKSVLANKFASRMAAAANSPAAPDAHMSSGQV